MYEWSSHHESNAQNNGDSYIMDNTPEEVHSGSADTASDPKLKRLFSNGAMNIIDQKLPRIGRAIVGEINTPKQRIMDQFQSPDDSSSQPSMNDSVKVEINQ